jgi:phosphatidylglycerophosphatase A
MRKASVNHMKEQKIENPPFLVVLYLSWFYTGKFPKASGTAGSLATLPLIYVLHFLQINIYSLFALIISLLASSIILTQQIQKKYHLHDPQWIVIDEVIGMLVCWSFVLTIDYPTLFLVFVTFRFFDIIKIWPASFFDRLHHGAGTILDDVVSGVYAGIITLLMQKLL